MDPSAIGPHGGRDPAHAGGAAAPGLALPNGRAGRLGVVTGAAQVLARIVSGDKG